MARISPEQIAQLESKGWSISPQTKEMAGLAAPKVNTPMVVEAIGPDEQPLDVDPIERDPQSVVQADNPSVAQPDTTQVALASDANAPTPQPVPGQSAQSGINRAYDVAQDAVIAEAQAKSEQAGKTAEVLDTMQVGLQKAQDRALVRQAEQEKQYTEALQKRDQLLADFATQEVDPEGLWRDKSTGQKVLAGIGLLLGAFGAAADPKGGNPAVKVLENAIERDIAAQKANLDKQGKLVDSQSGLLAEMRQKFQDDRQAEAATRMAYVDQMKLKIESLAQQYQSPVLQANAAKAIATLQMEREKANLEFEKATQAQQARMRLMGMGQSGEVDAAIMALPPEEQDKAMAKRVRVKEFGIDGLATTPERARALSQLSQDVVTARDSIHFLKKVSGRQLATEEKAQAEVTQRALIGSLRTAIVGPGPMNDSELALMLDIIGNPGQIFQIQAKPKLERLEQILEKKMKAAAEAEGLTIKTIDEQDPT